MTTSTKRKRRAKFKDEVCCLAVVSLVLRYVLIRSDMPLAAPLAAE
jgi:hypothetical protein